MALARPVSLPLAALVTLGGVSALLLAGLALWWGIAQRPAPLPVVLLATPTLDVPHRAQPAATLARAVIAYDAPGGAPLGALEPGRAYAVVARNSLDWAQLDVAQPGAPANLVWVAADAVPELQAAAGVADLATPAPTAAPAHAAAPNPQTLAPNP
ncbi:MAG: hypothetical protein HGA45_30660 [Chloroflexales bacterium]|nr:hypothetical protein [Chloroflexales bacterium]